MKISKIVNVNVNVNGISNLNTLTEITDICYLLDTKLCK